MASRQIPYLFSTGTTPLVGSVAGGVPSGPVVLPSATLVNTLRVPVEVTELNFIVDMPRLLAPPATSWEIDLSVGRYRMTNGFVVVGTLGPNADAQSETLSTGLPIDIAYSFRWILPRPLLVLPGEGFHGLARLSPSITYNQDGTGHLSFVARARRLAPNTPLPKTRAVPWATDWIFTKDNVMAPDTSFTNILNVPLNVKMIKVMPISATDIYFSDVPGGTITMDGPGGLANQVRRSIAVRQRIGAVLGDRSAIDEDNVLAPGKGYMISVTGTNAWFIAAGLTGWREEEM